MILNNEFLAVAAWNMPAATPVPAPVLTSGPQPYPLMFGPDPGVCLPFNYHLSLDCFLEKQIERSEMTMYELWT